MRASLCDVSRQSLAYTQWRPEPASANWLRRVGSTRIGGDHGGIYATMRLTQPLSPIQDTANGAPIGAPSQLHVRPGYHACNISAGLVVPGLRLFSSATLYGRIPLPRHASRGWSRVGAWLPCPDQRSVTPFYWVSSSLERPERVRFVMSMDTTRYIPAR